MPSRNSNGVTLVINTAQVDTYERFVREKDALLSGAVAVYDNAHIGDKNATPIGSGIFSYLKILFLKRPRHIVFTYDGSRSMYF
jgi:hypothetical protein